MFLFSGYSTQSVTIRENFALEKLRKLNSRKFSPSKITHYMVSVHRKHIGASLPIPEIPYSDCHAKTIRLKRILILVFKYSSFGFKMNSLNIL